MKRLASLLLSLILLLTCFSALAAVKTADVSPADYIEEPTAEPYSARRRVFVANEIVTVYTCPVRKNDVTVVFHSSERPIAVQVRLRIHDAATGSWGNETDWFVVPLGEDHTFELEYPARYEVQVSKVQGTDPNGFCVFDISASP